MYYSAPFQVPLLLASGFVAASSVISPLGSHPNLPHDPNSTDKCTWWLDYNTEISCQTILDDNYITIDQFRGWNPSIGKECQGMIIGKSYCVEGPFMEPPPDETTTVSTASGSMPPITTDKPTSTSASTTSTTTSTTSTSTNPDNGVSTPEPVQPNLVDNCNKFHYVVKGDTCDSISLKYGIPVSDFRKWNPSVGAQCVGLWADTYACVSVIGYTPPKPPTPTKPSNGVTTPSPTQPGLVENCQVFYKVQQGDSCDGIVKKKGISLSDFLKWNPNVGSDCKGLWADAYACVGVLSAFDILTRYHPDCTDDIHNIVREPNNGGDGRCYNLDCSVASLQVLEEGACPDGHIQISYWQNTNCQGEWYGYGYASKGTCRRLWTDGWKFKSMWMRCIDPKRDCVNQGTCKYDPEPNKFIC